MQTATDVQSVFRALADPTRRAIMLMLAEGERPISDISSAFAMTRPAVAKHLTVLRDGGLVAAETRGRERITRLRPEALRAAADWLNYFEAFWDERLAALKQAVEAEEPIA